MQAEETPEKRWLKEHYERKARLASAADLVSAVAGGMGSKSAPRKSAGQLVDEMMAGVRS